jgi:nucleoside-diphosphate-sugar epimerase
MMRILVFGLGYSALHFARINRECYEIAGTATTQGKATALSRDGINATVFSPEATDDALSELIAQADALLISIPPDSVGDPALMRFGHEIADAPRLRNIVYLSTIGVYGDYEGAWVDERTPCHPINERSRDRLAAETAWRALERPDRATHILRLAGIYGPGRNALVQMKRGTARSIVKPGQVFNRIHVADIASAINACLMRGGPGGVWNVCDDLPAPTQDVVAEAARLMGVAPPQEIPFDDADLSPIARSFYAECKRASNRAMKEQLGVRLAYPTYREGLRALWEDGEGK